MPLWIVVTGLFVLGFLFILMEVIIIPGFGLSGILGLISLAAACFIAFTRLSVSAGWAASIGSIALVIAFLKLFPRSAAWKKLRLDDSESSQKGFRAGDTPLPELVDKTGVALTMLRPSGAARIEGKRYDVMSDGGFIKKNVSIVVKKIDGNTIIVATRKERT